MFHLGVVGEGWRSRERALLTPFTAPSSEFRPTATAFYLQAVCHRCGVEIAQGFVIVFGHIRVLKPNPMLHVVLSRVFMTPARTYRCFAISCQQAPLQIKIGHGLLVRITKRWRVVNGLGIHQPFRGVKSFKSENRLPRELGNIREILHEDEECIALGPLWHGLRLDPASI